MILEIFILHYKDSLLFGQIFKYSTYINLSSPEKTKEYAAAVNKEYFENVHVHILILL